MGEGLCGHSEGSCFRTKDTMQWHCVKTNQTLGAIGTVRGERGWAKTRPATHYVSRRPKWHMKRDQGHVQRHRITYTMLVEVMRVSAFVCTYASAIHVESPTLMLRLQNLRRKSLAREITWRGRADTSGSLRRNVSTVRVSRKARNNITVSDLRDPCVSFKERDLNLENRWRQLEARRNLRRPEMFGLHSTSISLIL